MTSCIMYSFSWLFFVLSLWLIDVSWQCTAFNVLQLRKLLTHSRRIVCSLIPSRIDYCNAVLHGAPSYSIKKLRRVQNNAARIVLEASRRSHARPLLGTLHWLPGQHRIEYKVALLTFKVRSTSTPSYLRRLIQDRQHGHNLRSTTTTLCQPSTTTTFACETRFSMLCTGSLELITENCSQW